VGVGGVAKGMAEAIAHLVGMIFGGNGSRIAPESDMDFNEMDMTFCGTNVFSIILST
jgi:hypothetical protein